MKTRSPRHGYTLTEIMVAVAVLAIFSALAMPVFIYSMRSLIFTTNRFCLNQDFRGLTARLMKEARSSGQFILYSSFTDRTVVTSEGSGNFLVLMTMDTNSFFVTKCTGYYRHTDGTVRHFTVTEPGTKAVPQNLPADTTAGTHPIVVEFAHDSTDVANLDRLFLNQKGAGIVVYGQIRDDGKGTLKENKITPPAVSTYNFTISPRG
jgi:prepilin-type N-terminal cleavage/methylation domain-containing protein